MYRGTRAMINKVDQVYHTSKKRDQVYHTSAHGLIQPLQVAVMFFDYVLYFKPVLQIKVLLLLNILMSVH